MRVAIIGASADRRKFGNKAVRAYHEQGHEVVPVNPKGGKIEGLPVAATIASVSGPVDRASLYLGRAAGLAAVRELADRGDVAELWLNPGADDPDVVAEAEQLGLRVVRACSILAVGPMSTDR